MHTKQTPQAELTERPDLVAGHLALARKMGIPDHAHQHLRICTLGQCRIIVCFEEVRQSTGERRWHLSISHPWRLPTWDEVNTARDALIPADAWLCMPMPPKSFWINAHPFCLHLWQTKDADLIAQWAYDGCGDNYRAEEVAAEVCR